MRKASRAQLTEFPAVKKELDSPLLPWRQAYGLRKFPWNRLITCKKSAEVQRRCGKSWKRLVISETFLQATSIHRSVVTSSCILVRLSRFLVQDDGQPADTIQEQGPILEAKSKRVGVVVGAQAFRWHTVTVRGRESHTGATTFPYRSDAMFTAAKMIVRSHVRATELSCLASTGVLALKPGSTNTVPGEVKFSLDIRSGSDDQLMRLEKKLQEDFDVIARDEVLDGETRQGTKGRGCGVQWKLDASSKATRFNDSCIQCVRDSTAAMAEQEGFSFDDFALDKMISGAVHDR